MAISNFIPIVWSDKILQANESTKVFANLCNRSYEGDVSDKGDQVKINTLNDVAVSDYAGTVTYTDLADSTQTLLIDQDKYAAFPVQDLDKVQANVDLLNEATRIMGNKLANAEDVYIGSLHADAGLNAGSTTVAPIDINSANVTEVLSSVIQEMDENNVPKEGRVGIITPWFAQKVTLAKITKDTSNSAVLTNGYVGEYMGVQLYMSNNIAKSGTTWYANMFFVAGDGIAHVNQLTSIESLRLESQFADGVRARMVFGSKVIKPSSVCSLYAAPIAEV